MRNKDIEKIVDEWLHLSWASVWVSFSFARLFTGFFLSWGLTFTYYEDSEYKENPEALRKAQKGMENPDNYDIITNKSKTYKEKMDTINDILGDKYLTYYPESIIKTLPELWWWKQAAYITLSKEAFWKDIKIMCSPDLAPYIIQENGEIKLPGNADISLAQIRHQWKVESTLILGAKSTAGCEAIKLDNDKLSWEGKSSVEFGSKKDEFEKYNTEIKTKIETMNVWIDWKANEKLVDYLVSSEGSNALVNFRLSGKWSKFNDFIKANPDRWGESEDGKKKFVEDAKALLPDWLKNVKDAEWKSVDVEFTVDDIRFIYASLSRVSQTRDKQLTGEKLKSKANEYLSKLRLSSTNKALLEWYISKVEWGKALSDEEWGKMKSILGINYNNWEYKTSSSNAEKLFHILTPVKKLAENRTPAYKRRIEKEYAKLWWGADVLLNARNESLKKLEWKPTANGEIRGWWIGAVAWYDDRNSITDKFVSSPKIISESDVLIPESADLKTVKKHFLEELSRDDAAQFNNIKKKIVETLEKSTKAEDKKMAQEWRAMHDAEFIEAILNKTTKNEKNEDVNIVSFNMKYGFFADCVNETILLGDINVVTTTEEQIQAPHDVHYYDATIVNDAVTIWHDFSLWVTFGKVDTKDLDQPEDPEEPKEPEEPIEPEDETEPVETPTGSTEPFVDIDALWNATEVDFADKQMELDGKTYHLFNKTIDGHKCVIAVDEATKQKFIVVQNTSWAVELIAYENQWPSILANADAVAMKNHEEFLEKHKQWEENHKIFLKKHEEWQKAHDEWEIAHKEWKIAHKEWLDNRWKITESQEAYMKRHEEIIKALPTIYQEVAREIMVLNYQIQQAKPWKSSDLINKRRELLKKVDASIIDRMLQY